MPVVGTIAGGEPDLAEGVVEAGLLGDLREPRVVRDAPVGSLDDLAERSRETDLTRESCSSLEPGGNPARRQDLGAHDNALRVRRYLEGH